MNENLDLTTILKDCPKGTKLYSPLFGEVELDYTTKNLIICTVTNRENEHYNYSFSSNGTFFDYPDAGCLLFPAKDNCDWSNFRATKHFEPFQRVLVNYIDGREHIWFPNVYAMYDDKCGCHITLYGRICNDKDIIPYEGNEDKLGKKVHY